MKFIINDPPENGTCWIRIRSFDGLGREVWSPAKTGKALVDEFLIGCQDWKDPNDHLITKYVFKREKKKCCFVT